jgi:hypothetical protein
MTLVLVQLALSLLAEPFARQTSAFDAELTELRHQLLAKEGAYELYQLSR